MPAGLNRPTSDIEPIVGIQFGIFSPEEIERRSVVEITNAGTYDGNEPRIGGLFDPRMGVLDNGKTCRSCGQTNHSCPGHFGHFKLARPVYFIQFFPMILNVLNCVCVRCSKLLIDKTVHKEISRRRGEQRLRSVLTLCSSITRCGQEGEDGCGARQPERYVREGIARIVAEWDEMEGPGAGVNATKTKQRQYLEVEYVLRLFRRITDEDVDFLGLSRFWCRPDWMICSVMPIPPPQVRPSVIQDNNQRSEDDLTHKLFEIIMTNNRLQDKINNNLGKNLIEDEHTVLQYHVATLVDNQIPGVAPSAQRSGRPLKSVAQRLGSKEGRIRYNIQGKRVEFSARSVITPDPNISIAELGMPTKIAMNLTFPEKVTPYNMTKMYKLIQNVGPNGEERHPGAKTIVRSDGRMISLKHVNRKEIVLHVGDVVNRHIMDGDIVLFNRQPTLHRMSMMGHRVKVLPYNTFRLNVSVTAPYNADFDGDEMNAHIPQSYESSTELMEIAAVPHQIVTPRHAKPVIGIVQDTLVGSYRITRPHVNFNRREFMNMMMWNRRFEGAVPKGSKEVGGQQRWSGQQIISQLLPPINMDMGNGLYKDNKVKENFVRIREGEILEGIFDKDIFSKPSKGIIHTVFKDYGSTDTVNFIDSMQNTIEQFLVYNGFSVGVSDLIADEETRKQMEEVIKKRKVAIEDTLLQIHMDLFDNNTGKSNRQEFEDKVYGELNKATEEAGKIGLGSLSDENRLVAMVRAGSKGSTINIAQMMACVGQQAPEGRRIPYGFTDRTLPHYKKYDDGAEARGFVESSFIEGLTPQEFFFHAMSGREGLIDTAVKSVTGDTKIVVMEDGVTKCVAIGDWIDALLGAHSKDVEYFPAEANLELLQLPNSVSIQTCDDTGVISTTAVTTVTRHDPGDTLYEVTTKSGRSVIVTAAKSLIVYNDTTGLYTERLMADISVGDALPAIDSVDAKVVVKDIITTINPVDVRIGTSGYAKYPKMYDITVPSTLNFALENGLVVRDTADTGYIQRQLVKAMEDLTTQYDGTVRDSRMNILQFQYGEDGINATKIESASLGIAKLSEEEILKQYGMTGVDISGILDEGVQRGEDTQALAEFAAQVVADRKMLVEGIQRMKQDAPLFASVNLERVLTNVSVSFKLSAEKKTDLTPLYVTAGIERVIQRTQTKHALWAALLRYYLSPHKLIVKERFTVRAFDTACEMILVKNWQSWVQPGEQVGIIAAQSIGEPSTQMSSVGSTIIHVINVKTGKNFYGPISEFIDPLIGSTKPDASSVLRTELDTYRIVGVSQDEKVSWMPISEVSRHPANGGLVKVTTKSGRTTTATLSHSFLHRTEKGVEAIKGSDLRVGTRVPIATHVAETPDATIAVGAFQLNRAFGWLCGIYLADGSLSGNTVRISKIHPAVETAIRALATEYGWKISFREYQGEFGPSKDNVIHCKELRDYLLAQFDVGSYKKMIGADIYSYSREFQYGLLSGYFDGDGNVSAERHMIRVGSRSEGLIRHVNRLLSYCGFFGVLGEERSVNLPGKVMYTISILKKYAALFKERIGFTLDEKAAALDTIITWMERDGKHDTKELYDKIPALGDQIAALGKALNMPGQSRNYGRWSKKESVGRLTLRKYIDEFSAAGATKADLAPLVSAAYSDVVWDEITALEYLDDPKEFVYDFTVPGNDSFMVDDCIIVHNTLNTFHLAGVAAKSNVTRGVPRLKELLKVTHNPKAISLTVYLKPEFRGSKDKARQVAQDLELTLLKDIAVKTAIYYDPNDAETVVEEDADLIKFYRLFEKEAEEGAETTWSGWLLRFEMDRERMFRKNISMDDVAYVLRTRFGESLHLTYSDYNSNRLIMRMRLPEQMKNGLDDLTNLKKFQNRILNGIVFRGVPGIKSVTFREDKDMLELVDGVYKEVQQYVLDTDGSNYIQVMNHPYVDSTRLSSSHVHDIYEILGIEATRAVLLNEITTLFEEAGVGNRHLGLLCDVMTRGGRLMPSDRHGINKTDIGPLAKASFEETEKILLNAALFGELDPVTGVSANIMTGQVIRGGTGFFNVLLDEGAFMRMQEGLAPVEGYDEEEEGELTQEQLEKALYEDENDMCSSARLRMNVTIPNANKAVEEPDIEVMITE